MSPVLINRRRSAFINIYEINFVYLLDIDNN